MVVVTHFWHRFGPLWLPWSWTGRSKWWSLDSDTFHVASAWFCPVSERERTRSPSHWSLCLSDSTWDKPHTYKRNHCHYFFTSSIPRLRFKFVLVYDADHFWTRTVGTVRSKIHRRGWWLPYFWPALILSHSSHDPEDLKHERILTKNFFCKSSLYLLLKNGIKVIPPFLSGLPGHIVLLSEQHGL